MKKKLLAIILAVMSIGLVACGNGTSNGENTNEASNSNQSSNGSEMEASEENADQLKDNTIRLGTVSITLPAVELLKETVEANSDYKVEITEFTANNLPAEALKAGEIDGVFSYSKNWIDAYNIENNADLEMPVTYCYAPLAMYSNKFNSVDDIAEGSTISVPNGPHLISDSLRMMQDEGLITLSEKPADGNFYSEVDIKENPKNLSIAPVDIVNTVKSIDDVDAIVISTSGMKVSGVKDPADHICITKKEYNSPIGLTVPSARANEQWVKTIDELMHNEEVYKKFDDIYQGGYILEKDFLQK